MLIGGSRISGYVVEEYIPGDTRPSRPGRLPFRLRWSVIAAVIVPAAESQAGGLPGLALGQDPGDS